MNRIKNNMLDMYRRVKDFYTLNQTLIVVYLALDATFQKFIGKYTQIETHIISLSLDDKGITKQKKEAYDELLEKLHVITSVASVYYFQTNSLENYEKTNSTYSDYRKLREAVLLIQSKALYELINADIALMSDYGLNPIIMGELNVAINTFEALIQTPKEAIEERHTINTRIDELFITANDILKRTYPA